MVDIEVIEPPLRVAVPNPASAPRMPGRCDICRKVTDLADVNLRLWLSDGTRQPGGITEATDYLVGIGQPGNDTAIRKRLKTHMRHVEAFLSDPHELAPMQRDGRVSRLIDREDVRFPTVEQRGLNLGAMAMDALMDRIESGLVEDETLIGAAKIGSAVASKKGDRAAKGIDDKLDMLARISAGVPDPA